MPNLPKFESAVAVVLVGFALLQIGSIAAVQLGLVKEGIKLGFGFFLLGIMAIMVMLYVIVVKKQMTLDNRDIFGIVLIVAIVVAMFVFVPKLVPQMFDDTTLKFLNNVTMSMINGG